MSFFENTKEPIFVTKEAVNHVIHDKGSSSIQGVLLNLPSLIERAVLLDVSPDRNERSGATGAYTFLAAGNNKYGTIPVLLKVIEYPVGK